MWHLRIALMATSCAYVSRRPFNLALCHYTSLTTIKQQPAILYVRKSTFRTPVTEESRSEVRCTQPSLEISNPDKPRGGIPRFFAERLPASMGAIISIQGAEFLHMTKTLRLVSNDRVELFDGKGGLVEAQIRQIGKSSVQLEASHSPLVISPVGCQWQVVVACGSLKGGRADWLVEKCTELGASELIPLLTQRSPRAGEGRVDRWHRVALAAAKQCQRLHQLHICEPRKLAHVIQEMKKAQVSLLAAAESPPLLQMQQLNPNIQNGILLIGPEGDFTDEELLQLREAGAIPVGLGSRRLRVETAAIALLTGVMLLEDVRYHKK